MFAHFGIKDILDILIVATLLYSLYRLMKESGSINIFTGVLIFIGIWVVVTRILDMKLMGCHNGQTHQRRCHHSGHSFP